MANETKKLTLRDRQKAQPNAVLFLSDAERATIKMTVAKNLDEAQYKVFLYTCQALGLNPLLNEIAAVTYKNRDGGVDMSIQVMRDGFLTIAHRSGKFAGLESGVKYDEKNKMIGWAKVYHKDFTVPVYQEAEFEEYNTSRNLWTSKPKTMIKKVAESMALRKAFNVNGVYAPEEMEKEIHSVRKAESQEAEVIEDKPATDAQKENIRNLIDYDAMEASDKDFADEWINALTFSEAAQKVREIMSKPKGKK